MDGIKGCICNKSLLLLSWNKKNNGQKKKYEVSVVANAVLYWSSRIVAQFAPPPNKLSGQERKRAQRQQLEARLGDGMSRRLHLYLLGQAHNRV